MQSNSKKWIVKETKKVRARLAVIKGGAGETNLGNETELRLTVPVVQ